MVRTNDRRLYYVETTRFKATDANAIRERLDALETRLFILETSK